MSKINIQTNYQNFNIFLPKKLKKYFNSNEIQGEYGSDVKKILVSLESFKTYQIEDCTEIQHALQQYKSNIYIVPGNKKADNIADDITENSK